MENKQKNKDSFINEEKRSALSSLPKMEMYAVLGLEMLQRIYEKAEDIENSISVFAAQKARELNPEDFKVESDEKTS